MTDRCTGVNALLMLAGPRINSGLSRTWPILTRRILLGLGITYIDSTRICLVILAKVSFRLWRGRFIAA
jgi:hypothetical protein